MQAFDILNIHQETSKIPLGMKFDQKCSKIKRLLFLALETDF